MNVFSGYAQVFRKAKPYSLYVLVVLLLTYLLNQLCRYALTIVAKEMAQEIHFGDKACMVRKGESNDYSAQCAKLNASSCDTIINNATNATICDYNYNGQGVEYQAVVGPVFILIYTFMGIIISYFADKFQHRRVLILAFSLFLWSAMTLLSGFVTSYWQLVILRFGLGFAQAGCTPLASSLISDYFVEELRGSALGIYNWGIYTGYSMAFAIGNPILNDLSWKWVFIVSGIPGMVIAILMVLTVKQPKKEPRAIDEEDKPTTSRSSNNSDTPSVLETFKKIVSVFFKPSILLLCLASSIRNAAGYVWGSNNNAYYRAMGQTPNQIASWLGWIPIVGGLSGSFLGGFVSDRIVKKSKPYMRIWVLVISQAIATPFIFGVLFFDTPWSYIMLIPGYIFGEMWVGVCLSVIIELVPEKFRNSGVGFYFFIISNIGGNMQSILPFIQKSLKSSFNLTDFQAFKTSLYIFYPGEYVLGAVLFLLTLLVLKRDLNRLEQSKQLVTNNDEQNGHDNPAYDKK